MGNTRRAGNYYHGDLNDKLAISWNYAGREDERLGVTTVLATLLCVLSSLLSP